MVIRNKKSAHYKRHSPKKHTYKLKGGALTHEQERLYRMISKLLAWGSLGYIGWCSIMPVLEIVLSLLAKTGINTMTNVFYEVLWSNLVSTISSISTAAASAGPVVLNSVNVLSNAGNTCAAAHAVVRLANPLYKFALANLRRIIEVIENPLNINVKIKELSDSSKQILTTFLRDYQTLGGHAIVGLDRTSEAVRQLYVKMDAAVTQIGNNIQHALPKRTSSELEAFEENMVFLQKYEDLIFRIITKVVEGGEYGTSKIGKVKDILSWCAQGTMTAAVYAKSWVSYYFQCMNAPMERHMEDYVEISKGRKRARSPSPAPADMESLVVHMMTDKAEESPKRIKKTPSPSQVASTQVAVDFVENFSPEPVKIIKDRIRAVNMCPRGKSLPPTEPTRMIRSRAASERPLLPGEKPTIKKPIVARPTVEKSANNLRRRSGLQSRKISPIEASPEHHSSKIKSEGGKKNTYKRHKKRGGTRKI
jgi:hypothetical protein